jgi:hypothetical protein
MQAAASTVSKIKLMKDDDHRILTTLLGVGELGLNDFNCHKMWIGMNNVTLACPWMLVQDTVEDKQVWISGCTGAFAEYTLWSNDDCTGDGS